MTLQHTPVAVPDADSVEIHPARASELSLPWFSDEDATVPVRVGLTDSSDLVRSGLSTILDQHTERVHFVRGPNPRPYAVDLVLVDVDPLTNVDLMAARVRDHVDAGFGCVLAFGRDAGPADLARLRAAGAHDYVSMELAGEELVATVERAAERAKVGAPSDHRTPQTPPGTPGDSLGLTSREAQVMGLICRGHSNIQIGEELFLGVNTIKTYIRSAYRKIGVTSRSQAVIWGLENGL